jgi:hypothetical protein
VVLKSEIREQRAQHSTESREQRAESREQRVENTEHGAQSTDQGTECIEKGSWYHGCMHERNAQSTEHTVQRT